MMTLTKGNRVEPKRYSTTETATLVRQALRQAFAGHKFSVRSRSYSGGSSIDVSWTDGPTSDEVDPVITDQLHTWIAAGGHTAAVPPEYRPDGEDGDYVIESAVHITCKFCGFNIGDNRAEFMVHGSLTCESCGGTFTVPVGVLHDAQSYCLIGLGED